jgi:hypothetical protein
MPDIKSIMNGPDSLHNFYTTIDVSYKIPEPAKRSQSIPHPTAGYAIEIQRIHRLERN